MSKQPNQTDNSFLKGFLGTFTGVICGVIIGIGTQYVTAWTTPSDTAPNGNVSAPLTTGGTQTKNGSLVLDSVIDRDNPTYYANPAQLTRINSMVVTGDTQINKWPNQNDDIAHKAYVDSIVSSRPNMTKLGGSVYLSTPAFTNGSSNTSSFGIPANATHINIFAKCKARGQDAMSTSYINLGYGSIPLCFIWGGSDTQTTASGSNNFFPLSQFTPNSASIYVTHSGFTYARDDEFVVTFYRAQ